MRRLVAWVSLTAVASASFVVTTNVLAPTPCLWPVGDETQPPVDAQWLAQMAGPTSPNGPVPQRKPLAALTNEEWDDFSHALAIFRGMDRGLTKLPTNYLALAAHHGVDSTVKDQIGIPGLPAGRQWCECIHGVKDADAGPDDGPAPLFLLWHRAYIHAFELSIRSIMRYELTDLRRQTGGRLPDWQHFRLPYWDWAAPDDASAARRGRSQRRSNELAQIEARFVSPKSRCLSGEVDVDRLLFSGPAVQCDNPFFYSSRDVEFRPGDRTTDIIDFKRIANPFVASSDLLFADFERRLSDSWHQVIHTRVGDYAAGMASPMSAAQDPLFWIHHANVDRLWMAWVAESGGSSPEFLRNLEEQWRARAVRFPIPVNGIQRVYAPTYAAIGVDRASDVLGYRYASLDHVEEGPIERFPIPEDLERFTLEVCSRQASSELCKQPNSRTVLVGTMGEDLAVKGRGVVVTLRPHQELRDDITTVFTGTDPGSRFDSVYIGLRVGLNEKQQARLRLSGANSMVALQLYAVPRFVKEDPSNLRTDLSSDDYLGSVNLFSPNEAERWQYFGFSHAAAGGSVRRFLSRYPDSDWQIDIVFVPVFNRVADDTLEQDVVAKFVKFGIAARVRE